MNMIASLLLAAAILPLLAAVAAKAGGTAYNNNDPRPWLAHQQGWRARANAAQSNTFEALPFFYAAVLYALYADAPQTYLASLMLAWLVARLVYLAVYLAGMGSIRSLVWAIGLGLNIAILFAGT